MRPLIYYCASSLDGFIAGPNDEIDWLFTDGDYGFKEFFQSIDTVLTGRRTWDISKGFDDGTFKTKDVIVFSRSGTTLEQPSGKVDNLPGEPVEITRDLLGVPGKPVFLLGGGEIAGLLANAGLVSDLVVSVHPIAIGKGIPLFTGLKKHVKFEVVETESFPSGLIQITYRTAN